jgi:hypothetical protein
LKVRTFAEGVGGFRGGRGCLRRAFFFGAGSSIFKNTFKPSTPFLAGGHVTGSHLVFVRGKRS